MCQHCLSSWHEGITCDQAIYKDFQDYLKVSVVKRCPSCKKKVEKDGGCNHMRCIACSYEFCWICLREYERNHYKWWNIMGCPNHLYEEVHERNFLRMIWPCMKRSLSNFFVYIGMIFVLIFGLIISVLGGTVGFLVPFFMVRKNKKQKEFSLLLKFKLILLGLVFYPFLIIPGCIFTFSTMVQYSSKV